MGNDSRVPVRPRRRPHLRPPLPRRPRHLRALATASSAAAPITLAVNSHDDVAGVTFVGGEGSEVTFVGGEGSEVTFTVNEQLSRLPLPNDAVVRTDALSSSIHLDGRPSVVEIDLQQLESDQSRRDQYIHNRMFRSDPIATLTFDELPALPQSYTPGELFEGEIIGRFLILGAEHPLTFTVEARIDPDALLVLGRTTFTWDQIKVPRPSVRTVEVQDEVRVEVLIVARPTLDAAD